MDEPIEMQLEDVTSFDTSSYEEPIEMELEYWEPEVVELDEVPKTPIERIQKKAIPRWFETSASEGTEVELVRPSLIDTLRANFIEPMEVASEIMVGTMSYLPSWIAKTSGLATGKIKGMGEKETVERGLRWQKNTSDFINIMMHMSDDVVQPSEHAQRKLEMIGTVTELPKEWLAKPLGTAYGKLLNSDVAGEMATETIDMTINLALLPLMGAKLKAKVKSKLREGDVRAWKEAAENYRIEERRAELDAQKDIDAQREQQLFADVKAVQTPKVGKKSKAAKAKEAKAKIEAQAKKAKAAKEADAKKWLGKIEGFEKAVSDKYAGQLEADRVYGDLYAEQLAKGMDAKIRAEKQKMYEELWEGLDKKQQRILDDEYNPLFDEAEQRLMSDRYMEYEARQAVLDKVFNEEHAIKFIDSLEERIANRKPEEGVITPVELNDLYEKYLFKRIGDDPKLAEIWRQWDEAQERLYRQTDVTLEDTLDHPRISRMAREDQSLRHRAVVPSKRSKQVSRVKQRDKGDITAKTAKPIKEESTGIKKQYEALASMANDIAATKSIQVMAQQGGIQQAGAVTKLRKGGARSKTKDYIPPSDKTEFQVEMQKSKLQEDVSDTIKQLDELVKEEFKPKEGDTLSKTDVDDMINFLREEADTIKKTTKEGITQRSKKKAVVKAKQVANDLNDFFLESHELQKSNFEDSLDMESPREFGEIWEDIKMLSDERGMVGDLDPIPGKNEAVNRLVKDIQFLRRRAAQQGKKLVEYLTENGIARDIAEAVEKHADEIVESPSEDFSKAGDYPAGDARNINRMFEETEKAMKEEARRSFVDSLKEARKEIYARDGDVKQFLANDPSAQARRAWNRKVLTPGAYPAASVYYDKLHKNIFSHLSRHEIDGMNKLIHVRAELSKMYRKAKNRTPKGTTYADYVAFMDNAQQNLKLSTKSYRKVVQATEDYMYAFNDLLLKQYEEGAIPKWLYDRLKENEYAPTSWLQAKRLFDYANEEGIPLSVGKRPPNSIAEMEGIVHKRLGKKTGDLTVQERNLYTLKGGMEGYRNLNYQELLAEAVTSTYKWVYDNRATKSLGKLAKEKGVDGDVIRTAEIRRSYVDEGGEVYHSYAKPEPGWKELSYFDDGQKVIFHARDWFAEQWSKNSTQGRNLTLFGLRLDKIGNVLRFFATGAGAPLFGITKGIFMDVFYGYMTSQVKNPEGKYVGAYSSFFPKYLYQVGRNMGKVSKDVIMRKGKYLDAVEDGMLFNALAQTEGTAPKAHGKIRGGATKIADFFGYMNNSLEYMVRMAHREQFIEQGYSPWEATAMARDMLDYAQGGWTTKKLDTGIPYTNTAVQGTRGIFRSLKNNPKEFAWKAANLMGVSAALYVLHKTINQEAYEHETDYNKDTNFIIPTGFSLKDDYGNTRHLNIKIKKDPGQALLCTTAELLMARAMGDEADFKRLFRAGLGLVSPWQKIPNVPLIEMGLTYTMNKDMYTLADIWKGNPAGKEEWYEKRTSQMWKDLGEITGGSPERTKAAIESLVTRDNFILETTGHLYDKAFKDLPMRERESLVATFLLDNWAPDVFSLTREPSNRYEDIKEDEKEVNGQRVVINTQVDAWADQYFVYAKTDEERNEAWQRFLDVASKLDKTERKRAMKRFKVHGQTVGFPHQNMWKLFSGINDAEVRAKHIWKWRNEFSTLEERQEIDRRLFMLKRSDASFIPSDVNSKFWKAYRKEMYNNPDSKLDH